MLHNWEQEVQMFQLIKRNIFETYLACRWIVRDEQLYSWLLLIDWVRAVRRRYVSLDCQPCFKNIQVSMFCTYVVKYLDLIQSTWTTRASIYLIQNIVTKLSYKVIIFQVIRCIPLATLMKFLYILYICKWPPVNTVYYFVTNVLYKEPENTCYTDDR